MEIRITSPDPEEELAVPDDSLLEEAEQEAMKPAESAIAQVRENLLSQMV